MAGSNENPAQRRAVIVTALAVEYRAVRAHLHDLREEIDPSSGTIYEVGRFRAVSENWEVAIVQTGMGNVAASIGTERALLRFRPEVVLLVGLANGISPGVALGDVVVATQVISYDRSRLPRAGEPFVKFDVLHSSYRLQQRAQFEATREAWLARRRDVAPTEPSPRVLIGVMASGEKFPANHNALRLAHRDALAVDMESSGILGALHGTPDVEVLVVRGISDLADGSKAPAAQDIAARNASAFAFEVLAKLGEPRTTQPVTRTAAATEPLAKRYLTRILISGLRSVDEIVWQIDADAGPGWHVMIGDNGAGKSTVLRTVALTLFGARETEALRQNWSTWLRTGREIGRAAITLSEPKQDQPLMRSIALQAVATAPSTASVAGAPGTVVLDGVDRDAPADVFSASYGPFRRFSGGDLEYEKEIVAFPRLVRHLSLFSERAALTESLAWLKELRFKQLEQNPEGELLRALREFINGSGLLPQGAQLAEVSSEAVTFIDGNGCPVAIEELSDGFRSVLSLTLDLLRHLATAYGASGVFSRVDPTRVIAPGLVLIDEVDVHLHPTWQHQLGHWFRKHFPEIQFIVTTHSPLMCQAADTVFLLPRPGTEERGRMLAGAELDRVRYGNVLDAYGTGVFGQGVTRSEESKVLLQRLAELNARELDEELTPDEQAEQEYLRRILPTGSRPISGINAEPLG